MRNDHLGVARANQMLERLENQMAYDKLEPKAFAEVRKQTRAQIQDGAIDGNALSWQSSQVTDLAEVQPPKLGLTKVNSEVFNKNEGESNMNDLEKNTEKA